MATPDRPDPSPQSPAVLPALAELLALCDPAMQEDITRLIWHLLRDAGRLPEHLREAP